MPPISSHSGIVFSFISIVCLYSIAGCSTNQKVTSFPKQFEEYQSEENDTGTYVLYTQKEENQTNYPKVKYYVLNKKDNKVEQEGIISSGYIRWISTLELEVLEINGTIKPNQSMNDFKRTIKLNNE